MALTKIQRTVLDTLKNSPLCDRFYWTGGTLLSEHFLHHRRSEDIDLFADDSFQYREIIPFVHSIRKMIGNGVRLEEKHIFDRWEFFVHNHEKIRFEFVHYPFPSISKRTRWNGIWIDSLEDIIANKVLSAMERHEPKDVVDLYILLLKKKYTLKRAIVLAQKKFEVSISLSALLSDIMATCQILSQVQPMLYGTLKQQKELVQQIIRYFERQSSGLIHRAWI